MSVDHPLNKTVLRHFPFEPVDTFGSVLDHRHHRLRHCPFLAMPDFQVTVDAEQEICFIPLRRNNVHVADSRPDRFHQTSFEKICQCALINFSIEKIFIDLHFIIRRFDADLIVFQEF